MAWLAIDKNGAERIYEFRPIRLGNRWNTNMDSDQWIILPKGSVEKLTGKKINWNDEPIEI